MNTKPAQMKRAVVELRFKELANYERFMPFFLQLDASLSLSSARATGRSDATILTLAQANGVVENIAADPEGCFVIAPKYLILRQKDTPDNRPEETIPVVAVVVEVDVNITA